MPQLTGAKVKNAGVGKHQDGQGLFLRVYESGSRCWVLRLTVDGRRREIGLGGWPEASLAYARTKAFGHRAAAASGRDPLADKRRGDVQFNMAGEVIDGALPPMTLTKILRDVGLADRATVRGFRASFRTWALE